MTKDLLTRVETALTLLSSGVTISQSYALDLLADVRQAKESAAAQDGPLGIASSWRATDAIDLGQIPASSADTHKFGSTQWLSDALVPVAKLLNNAGHELAAAHVANASIRLRDKKDQPAAAQKAEASKASSQSEPMSICAASAADLLALCAELRALKEKATDGQWYVMKKPAPSWGDHGHRQMAMCGQEWMVAASYDYAFDKWDNQTHAQLIAALHNAADTLISAAESSVRMRELLHRAYESVAFRTWMPTVLSEDIEKELK